MPVSVSPGVMPLQQPGHPRGTVFPQSTKPGCQRRAPALASHGSISRGRVTPALALDARGHRGASATPPSSRLLPPRLCPPPKISCSPAVPSRPPPAARGALPAHAPAPARCPGSKGGRGASSLLHHSLTHGSSAATEQRSPAVTSARSSVPEGELWLGFMEQRPSRACDTPSAPRGGGSGGHAGFWCCCCLVAA